MMRRLARPFAVVGLVGAIAGGIGALTLRVLDPAPPISYLGFGDASLVAFVILGVVFASVGALLVVRRPANLIGWMMVLIGVGYAVGVFWAAATFSIVAHPSAFGGLDPAVTGWLAVLFTTIGGLVFAIGFIFPTGRGQTPAWDRGLIAAALISPWLIVILFLIRPGPLHLFPTIDNPIGVGPDLRPWLGDRVSAWIAATALFLLPIVIWSLASRYRLAGRAERQQLKWFGLATAMAMGALAVTGVNAVLFYPDPPEIGLALFAFAGAFVPIAIGVAILRHGLYDIDRVISRTIAYAVVTGVLALTFAATILLLQAVLSQFTQGQTVAVAASTLAVFALFQPLIRRVRRAVDRRFDRVRYDAERTAAAFSERLRDEMDLATVTTDLTRTTEMALAPSSLGIWIRPQDLRHFAIPVTIPGHSTHTVTST